MTEHDERPPGLGANSNPKQRFYSRVTPILTMVNLLPVKSLSRWFVVALIHLGLIYFVQQKINHSSKSFEPVLYLQFELSRPSISETKTVASINVTPRTTLTMVHRSQADKPINLPPRPIAAESDRIAQPTPEETNNAPKLDLDALRAYAVQQELSRQKSPVELLQEANAKNHSLEARVELAAKKAQRSDCRTAYTGAGLLAPFAIAADIIRDKGCKF